MVALLLYESLPDRTRNDQCRCCKKWSRGAPRNICNLFTQDQQKCDGLQTFAIAAKCIGAPVPHHWRSSFLFPLLPLLVGNTRSVYCIPQVLVLCWQNRLRSCSSVGWRRIAHRSIIYITRQALTALELTDIRHSDNTLANPSSADLHLSAEQSVCVVSSQAETSHFFSESSTTIWFPPR